jgi:ketosteroid isomerase-like protein
MLIDRNCLPGHYGDVTTPFDDPQAELAWMFLQSLCDGADVDEGLALLSDDFSYWSIITRTPFDKETLRRAIEQRKHYLPEINIELIRCVNEGETVVVEGQVDATTAEGARYDSPFVCIFDTRDGLIVSAREYSDTRLAARVFPTRL